MKNASILLMKALQKDLTVLSLNSCICTTVFSSYIYLKAIFLCVTIHMLKRQSQSIRCTLYDKIHEIDVCINYLFEFTSVDQTELQLFGKKKDTPSFYIHPWNCLPFQATMIFNNVQIQTFNIPVWHYISKIFPPLTVIIYGIYGNPVTHSFKICLCYSSSYFRLVHHFLIMNISQTLESLYFL